MNQMENNNKNNKNNNDNSSNSLVFGWWPQTKIFRIVFCRSVKSWSQMSSYLENKKNVFFRHLQQDLSKRDIRALAFIGIL